MRAMGDELRTTVLGAWQFTVTIGVALLVGFASFSANAAEGSQRQTAGPMNDSTAGSGVRVFSKDKPLFPRRDTIPSTTPDRTGKTRVEVIVQPNKPTRAGPPADTVETGKRASQALPLPQVGSNRLRIRQQSGKDGAGKDLASKEQGFTSGLLKTPELVREGVQPRRGVAPKTTPAVITTKAESITAEPKPAANKVKISSVLLPTAKPAPPSAYQPPRADRQKAKRFRRTVPGKIRKSGRSRHVTSRRPRRFREHRRYTRLRPSSRRRARLRRGHYWRRHAPPGTVRSFVRCWPGEPCVRYYRVRRPRTERQYRRLLAWQRRQDARLRYRRYYRRY